MNFEKRICEALGLPTSRMLSVDIKLRPGQRPKVIAALVPPMGEAATEEFTSILREYRLVPADKTQREAVSE